MTSFRITLTLLLLVAAVLLAAGCLGEKRPTPDGTPIVSSISTTMPAYPEEPRPLPEGKYLYVGHFTQTGSMTVEGSCDSVVPSGTPPWHSLDKQTGNLSIRICPECTINASLLMVYGGVPVNSFPRKFVDGVTITQVNFSGYVFVNYQNTSIILKPNERLVFNRSEVLKTTERKGEICTKKIVRTDTFYHEGFFDIENITVSYHEKCWPGRPIT